MQVNIKPYLVIMTTIIILFSLLALLRNSAPGRQVEDWGAKNQSAMKGIVLTVFLVFVAAAIPVLLHHFLKVQTRIGNESQPFVKLVRHYGMKLVYMVWIVFGLGLAISLPYMIKDGFFSNTSK